MVEFTGRAALDHHDGVVMLPAMNAGGNESRLVRAGDAAAERIETPEAPGASRPGLVRSSFPRGSST